MKRACQIRIYPTERQKRLIGEQLECHRLLYNTILEDTDKLWNEKKEKIPDFTLITKYVNHFRKTDKRFSSCNYSSLQHTVRRFTKARKAMIKKRVNKKACSLRYKPSHRFNSIEYTISDGLSIKKDRIRIQNIGEIKAFWHQTPQNPTYAILTRRGTEYYVTFFQEYHNDAIPVVPEKNVGVDFGVKTLMTFSDGTKIEPPKFAKRDKKDLARAHKKIHVAEKGSREREKRKKIVATISKRIANRRKNFNHQITRKLVNTYDLICLEDLNPTDILSFSNINYAIYDLGIGQLKNFFAYKAENAGKHVVFVNPAYTTQTCSVCGKVKEKSLAERTHSCLCGYTECRDVNAAKNILALGLQSLTNVSVT